MIVDSESDYDEWIMNSDVMLIRWWTFFTWLLITDYHDLFYDDV